MTDFGRTTSSIRSAEAAARAQELATGGTRNEAALEFVLAYVALLESKRLLSVTGEEVLQFEAHLADAEARYQEGIVTVNDVLQAKVTLSDARQRNLRVKGLNEVAASRVNFLLLRPLSDPIEIEDVADLAPLDRPDPATAMTWAEENRYEIRVLQQQVEAKTEEVRSLNAGHYPTFFLSAGYAYEENEYRDPEDNLSLAAGLSWDLYSGGATRAAVIQGDAALEGLLQEQRKLREQVRLQVTDTLVRFDTARERVAVTEQAVVQARESLRLQRAMYEEGEGTATDVTDAVTRLTVAERNYWTALYGVRRAEAQLLYAMGRDLADVYGDRNAAMP